MIALAGAMITALLACALLASILLHAYRAFRRWALAHPAQMIRLCGVLVASTGAAIIPLTILGRYGVLAGETVAVILLALWGTAFGAVSMLPDLGRERELLPYTGEPFWERDDDTDEAVGPRLTAEEVAAFHRDREASWVEWRAVHIDGARRRRVEAQAKRAAEESVWYRETYQTALRDLESAK